MEDGRKRKAFERVKGIVFGQEKSIQNSSDSEKFDDELSLYAKFEELFGEGSFSDENEDDVLKCNPFEKQNENDAVFFMDIGHIVTLKT